MNETLNTLIDWARSLFRKKAPIGREIDINWLGRQMVKAKIPLTPIETIAKARFVALTNQDNQSKTEKIIELSAETNQPEAQDLAKEAVTQDAKGKLSALKIQYKVWKEELAKARKAGKKSAKAYREAAREIGISPNWKRLKTMPRFVFFALLFLLFGCEATSNISLMLNLFRENVVSSILLGLGSCLGLSFLADVVGLSLTQKDKRSKIAPLTWGTIGLLFTALIGYGRLSLLNPVTTSWAHYALALSVPIFFFLIMVLLSREYYQERHKSQSVNTTLQAALADKTQVLQLRQKLAGARQSMKGIQADKAQKLIALRQGLLAKTTEKDQLTHQILHQRRQTTLDIAQVIVSLRVLEAIYSGTNAEINTDISAPDFGPIVLAENQPIS